MQTRGTKRGLLGSEGHRRWVPAGTARAERVGRLTRESGRELGVRCELALRVQVSCAKGRWGGVSVAPNGVWKRGYCLA